jgi:hypothetical protein
MAAPSRSTGSFPSARLPSPTGGLPVEVTLIAQLGTGAGDAMLTRAIALQRRHGDYLDALDEPSARLGGIDLARDDFTSLYSFAVGAHGHPFHRHAGHRVFTAISGSSGALLRFAGVSKAQLDADPQSFVRALRHIEVPPDSLFTVRFPGDTWHQFLPLGKRPLHPALFALSCHTNELGGDLSDELSARVSANAADIACLTEVLPEQVADLLRAFRPGQLQVPTVRLSLEHAPTTIRSRLCAGWRGSVGLLRGVIAGWRQTYGFRAMSGGEHAVEALDRPPPGSMLAEQLEDGHNHHQDTFRITLALAEVGDRDAAALLSRLLDGFLDNPPWGVSRLMKLRNLLVKPLGLRTSPLGCPVSSLLSPTTSCRFSQRFPVLDQRIDADGRRAQVILGANDKHLVFRSCVGVQVFDGQRIEITLGTRVRCRNLFGRIYLAAIDRIHRGYVTPTILRMAVEHAFPVTAIADFTARDIAPSAALDA